MAESKSNITKKYSSPRYEKIAKILSERRKGKYHKGHKFQKGDKYNIGKPCSEETRKKISEANKGKNRGTQCGFQKGHKINIGKFVGEKGPGWKGGVSTKNEIDRKSLKFREWRVSVFERDDFTCWICGERGGKLHPHHIKDFAYFPELRFELNNGLTLCEFCHKTYTKFGGKAKQKIKT